MALLRLDDRAPSSTARTIENRAQLAARRMIAAASSRKRAEHLLREMIEAVADQRRRTRRQRRPSPSSSTSARPSAGQPGQFKVFHGNEPALRAAFRVDYERLVDDSAAPRSRRPPTRRNALGEDFARSSAS